MTAHGYAFIF